MPPSKVGALHTSGGGEVSAPASSLGPSVLVPVVDPMTPSLVLCDSVVPALIPLVGDDDDDDDPLLVPLADSESFPALSPQAAVIRTRRA